MNVQQSVPSLSETGSSSFHWSRPSRTPLARPGLGSLGLVRLGANESPYGPIPEVAERIATACMRVNRYPDVSATALRTVLAQQLGIRAGQLLVGNGSSELIHMLTTAFGGMGTEIMIPFPSFPMYAGSVSYTPAKLVSVPIKTEGTMDLTALLGSITDRTSLLFLCNPNNPTGGHVSLAHVRAFLQQVPDHVVIALDEAYWEFTDAFIDGTESSVSLCEQFPNLIVLRTFSKFYGLAGLRVGYAVTHNEEIASRLSSVRLPAMPNTIGLEGALACVEHHEAYLQRASDVAHERRRVVNEVRNLGYGVLDTKTNFFCLPFAPGPTPFFQAGIHVRGGDTIQMPGHIRISLGTMEENDQAIDVLRRHASVSVQSASESSGEAK